MSPRLLRIACTTVIWACAIPAAPFFVLYVLFWTVGFDTPREPNDYDHPEDGLQIFTLMSLVLSTAFGFYLISEVEKGIEPPDRMYWAYGCLIYTVATILVTTAMFVRNRI